MKGRLLIAVLLVSLVVLSLAPAGPAQVPEPTIPAARIFLPLILRAGLRPWGGRARNVELIGQLGGSTGPVAVQGDYAYISVGPRLVVLDISDPAQPTVVSQTDVSFGEVADIAVTGTYAVVVDHSCNLWMVDLSNPVDLVVVGSCRIGGYARAVTVAGDYAYVAYESGWRSGGMSIVDISDPSAPFEAGVYSSARCPARDVAIREPYAYVAEHFSLKFSRGGLVIVDVSDPTAPVEVAYYDAPLEGRWKVAIREHYLYVLGHGLHIMDISDPVVPIEVGSYDTRGGPLVLVGDYAYVGQHILDVSNPAAVVEVGTCPIAISVVDAAGQYAFGVGELGLHIIDISDRAHPVEVGFYDTGMGLADQVTAAGDYAYVASRGHSGLDWPARLYIVDVSNPTSPIEVGFLAGSTGWYETEDVAVSGSHAYVAAYDSLRIIDVSNPTSPMEVGPYITSGVEAIVANGHYVYIVSGASPSPCLRVIDVSDPSSPVEVGSYEAEGHCQDLAVAEEYAYVVGQDGLSIVDLSNPTAPTEVGRHSLPEVGRIVAVAGDYAYVVCDGNPDVDLRILDIADPYAPREVAAYDLPGAARDVALDGHYAFVVAVSAGTCPSIFGSHTSALHILDVSNPAIPVEVGFYDMPGYGWPADYSRYTLALSGDAAYLAYHWAGLVILRFIGEGPAAMVDPVDALPRRLRIWPTVDTG